MTTPDPAPILDLIEAFRRSKAMFTAVCLGVFDQLEMEAQGVDALAGKLKVNASMLKRLLDACGSLSLLDRSDDTYRNTAIASQYLVGSSPDTLAGYIVYSDQSLYRLWAHLEDAIREGTNRWSQVFGSREALFAHYFRDNSASAAFLAGMHGFGQISSPLVVRAFDLSRFNHLVDLGGATGHLAVAACQAYPQLTATVLDLPIIEPFAQGYLDRAHTAGRIKFVGADFFEDALPAGDLYALGRIIHDWTEAQVSKLLGKIFAALPHGGGLLIAEAVLDDDRTGPVHTLMQDLNMLVCTDGKERTFDEYRSLLEAAGFINVESCRTGAPLDAILAIKGE